MISKRGQLGSSIMTVYRVLVLIIIAFVILGASSLVYSHHINTRDSEAMILVHEISECVITDSVVDLNKLKSQDSLFEYCGFESDEMENFFVRVLVEFGGSESFKIEDGDSGFLFVKDIFNMNSDTGAIDKYEPGHFVKTYDVLVLSGGEKSGKVSVEVVANAQ